MGCLGVTDSTSSFPKFAVVYPFKSLVLSDTASVLLVLSSTQIQELIRASKISLL